MEDRGQMSVPGGHGGIQEGPLPTGISDRMDLLMAVSEDHLNYFVEHHLEAGERDARSAGPSHHHRRRLRFRHCPVCCSASAPLDGGLRCRHGVARKVGNRGPSTSTHTRSALGNVESSTRTGSLRFLPSAARAHPSRCAKRRLAIDAEAPCGCADGLRHHSTNPLGPTG